MITVHDFSINFHVANEHQSTDIEGKLSKEAGEDRKFEVSLEIIDYKPDEDGIFVACNTHNHNETFIADSVEEAMDIFTGLLNSLAMPLLEWAKSETLGGVETKPESEPEPEPEFVETKVVEEG